jgi:hypothetical protein
MKSSADPLILKRSPYLGDLHPKSPQWYAIDVRLLDSADIEGKVIYAGPQREKVIETFVLRPSS